MELEGQIDEPFDAILFASSSGSTQVGLAHCFREMSTRVLGLDPRVVCLITRMRRQAQ